MLDAELALAQVSQTIQITSGIIITFASNHPIPKAVSILPSENSILLSSLSSCHIIQGYLSVHQEIHSFFETKHCSVATMLAG